MIALLIVVLLASAPGNGYPVSEPVAKATVSCFGDSLFPGQFCAELDSLLPIGYEEFSHGIAGETSEMIYQRVLNEALTACSGEPCGYYEVNGAVNTLKIIDYNDLTDDEVAELALNGLAPSLHGSMDTVDWLYANIPNATISLVGVLPYKACDELTCPFLTRAGERARAYNSKMMEACASRPWLRCVDPYEEFEEPHPPGEHSDILKEAYRYLDGIHLTLLGLQALAAKMFSLHSWP